MHGTKNIDKPLAKYYYAPMADGNSSNIPQPNFSIVLIGIGLLTLLFISYIIFNSRKTPGSVVDVIMEKVAQTQQKGEIDGLAAQDVREKQEVAGARAERAGGSSWVATDYKSGDIKTGSYTVKRGDTLWEIAEAVYGDGTQWHKILENNKDSIGFLPNGSQALIEVGQILTIIN